MLVAHLLQLLHVGAHDTLAVADLLSAVVSYVERLRLRFNRGRIHEVEAHDMVEPDGVREM
jgi:hypothetical protein